MEKTLSYSELPENIKPLVNLLMSQDKEAYNTDSHLGWEKVTFKAVEEGKVIVIKIPSAEIGFSFFNGKFSGIYNYKE